MKINELKEKQTFDELIARILSKQGPRRIKTKLGMSYVTDILLADETGTTVFNLYGIQKAENLKIGQIIKIRDGWCKLSNYQKQISLGKSGRMSIVIVDDPKLPRTIPH